MIYEECCYGQLLARLLMPPCLANTIESILAARETILQRVSLIATLILCSSHSNFAMAEGVAEAIERAVSYRHMHHTAPTLDFFFAEIEGSNLTLQEETDLYIEITKLQSPPITTDQIVSILSATRDSIQSCSCKYKCDADPTGSTYEYIFSNNKYLFGEPIRGAESGETSRTSFDGEIERSVLYTPGQLTNASIDKSQSLSKFYRVYMPLGQAMMFKANMTSTSGYASDLAGFLQTDKFQVFEKTEEIDKSKCLIVANLGYRFFLDLDRNFALRRLDSLEYEYGDPDSNGLRPMRKMFLANRKEHSEFHDYGNGVWLPSKIKNTHYQRGPTPIEETITVSEMKINPQIQDSAFSDIIPNNAFVADGMREMTYNYGDRASIGQLISERVPEKFKWGGLLIWVNAVAFLVILIVFTARWITKFRTAGCPG